MSQWPSVKAKHLLAALLRIGWQVKRQSGSHKTCLLYTSVLTGLANRVLLADRLQQAMAQAQRRGQCVAVAMLDLDGFQAINDRYGHGTGDQLLITVLSLIHI